MVLKKINMYFDLKFNVKVKSKQKYIKQTQVMKANIKKEKLILYRSLSMILCFLCLYFLLVFILKK